MSRAKAYELWLRNAPTHPSYRAIFNAGWEAAKKARIEDPPELSDQQLRYTYEQQCG